MLGCTLARYSLIHRLSWGGKRAWEPLHAHAPNTVCEQYTGISRLPRFLVRVGTCTCSGGYQALFSPPQEILGRLTLDQYIYIYIHVLALICWFIFPFGLCTCQTNWVWGRGRGGVCLQWWPCGSWSGELERKSLAQECHGWIVLGFLFTLVAFR